VEIVNCILSKSYSGNKINEDGWGTNMHGKHIISVKKSEGKGPLERSWHGWEDNIKMNREDISCEHVEWVHLTCDRSSGWLF
jgi:hypothetical protein